MIDVPVTLLLMTSVVPLIYQPSFAVAVLFVVSSNLKPYPVAPLTAVHDRVIRLPAVLHDLVKFVGLDGNGVGILPRLNAKLTSSITLCRAPNDFKRFMIESICAEVRLPGGIVGGPAISRENS